MNFKSVHFKNRHSVHAAVFSKLQKVVHCMLLE